MGKIDANKQILSAKNTETALLSKEVAKVENDYLRVKQEFEQANRSAQHSSDQLKTKKDEVAELQKSFAIAGDQISQTQKDLRATESQLAQLNERLNQKGESKKWTITDLESLKSQIAKANEQTLSMDREITNLTASQQDAQTKLKLAKISLEQSQHKLQEAKSTSGNLVANLSDIEKENLKASNELSSLQNKLKGNSEKKTSIAEDQSRIISLTASTTQENVKIEEQIKAALALHDSVKQNLQTLSARNSVIKASLNETLSSAEQQKLILKQATDEKQKFDKQLSEKISHLDTLNASLRSLENQKEKITTATQKVSDEAGRVAESIKQIQSQLVSATEDKNAKQLVLSDAKSELEERKKSLSEQLSQLALVNNSLADAKKQKTETDKAFAQSTQAALAAKTSIELLEASISKTQTQIDLAKENSEKTNQATLAKKTAMESLTQKLQDAKNALEAAQKKYKVEDGEFKELSAAVTQATKARELTETKLRQLENEKSRLSKQLNQENSHERQLSTSIASTTQNINSLALSIEKNKLSQQQARDQILILEQTKASNMAEHNAEAAALTQAKQALMLATQERKAREQELSSEKTQRLTLEKQAFENAKEIARTEKLAKENAKIEEFNYLRQSQILAQRKALETAKNAEIERVQSKLLQNQLQQKSDVTAASRINGINTQQTKFEQIELVQAPPAAKVSSQKKDRFNVSTKNDNDTLFDQ